MTTIKAAEAGFNVELISLVPVKRSHSVCAQGGINAAVNTKGEGDSPWQHFDDTVYGGDFLGDQPLIKGMCEAAPCVLVDDALEGDISTEKADQLVERLRA
jgi:succinate dehydrogenase / fumarate reductase flavoprotein subunit